MLAWTYNNKKQSIYLSISCCALAPLAEEERFFSSSRSSLSLLLMSCRSSRSRANRFILTSSGPGPAEPKSRVSSIGGGNQRKTINFDKYHTEVWRTSRSKWWTEEARLVIEMFKCQERLGGWKITFTKSSSLITRKLNVSICIRNAKLLPIMMKKTDLNQKVY